MIESIYSNESTGIKVSRIREGDRIYAVKEVPMENWGIPNLMECMTGKLSHPNLLPFEKIILKGDKILLYSEFAQATLKTIGIRSKSIYWKWIRDILFGLNYLHNLRIIHGDIKAENILIFSELDAKLADFGCAKFSWSPSKGTCAYTPTHRAPEIWENRDWGILADIWGLGCTIYELVTGEKLFPFNPDREAFIETLKTFNKVNIPEFDKIINDCILYDTNLRPTASKLLAKYFAEYPLYQEILEIQLGPEAERIINSLKLPFHIKIGVKTLVSRLGSFNKDLLPGVINIVKRLLYLEEIKSTPGKIVELEIKILEKLDWNLVFKI